LGDIAGLAADARMYQMRPEERTMGNYALSALGVLPFVPSVSAVKTAGKGVKTAAKEAKIRLYRASPDDYVTRGTSFTEDAETARAYQDNPGFGGSEIYSTRINPKNVLDLSDEEDQWTALSSAIGEEIEPSRYAYHFARSLTADDSLTDKLAESGVDWIKFRDDFPEGSKTWIPVSDKAIDNAYENNSLFNPKNVESALANKGVKTAAEELSDLAPLAAKTPPASVVKTETPEFKNFFGESKVVDADGKPLMVYHGTTKDFDTFRPNYARGQGTGVYFSDIASDTEAFSHKGSTMPVFLRMEKPYFDYLPPNDRAKLQDADRFDESADVDSPRFNIDYRNEELRRLGYDGIISKEGNGITGSEYFVFEPTQIKSAIGNEGTFDPTNPVITKADGGLIKKYATGSEVSSNTADLIAQMNAVGNMSNNKTPNAPTPNAPLAKEQTDSAKFLAGLLGLAQSPRNIVDNILYHSFSELGGDLSGAAKNATAGLTDAIFGMRDLAKTGGNWIGDKLMEQGLPLGTFLKFASNQPSNIPSAQEVKETLGVENADPYSPSYVLGSIGPSLAGSGIRGATTLTAKYGPQLAEELGAYVGGDTAANLMATLFPDSTLAQIGGSVVGSIGGSAGINAARNVDVPSNVMASLGNEVPPTDSAKMLNDLDNAGSPLAPQSDVPVVPETDLPVGPETESRQMLNEFDETGAVSENVSESIAPLTGSAKMLDDLDVIPERISNLSRKEISVLNAGSGRNQTRRAKARAVGEEFKTNYSTENGWASTQINKVVFKDGLAKVETKPIAYGFEKAPEGVDSITWENTIADNIVNNVQDVVNRAANGDRTALGIISQANWYRTMRDRLRAEFGGMGDVFADTLGATSAQTNVEQNFNNAADILKRYSRGDFDVELETLQKRIDSGERFDSKTLTAMFKNGEFPLITKESGKLYGANSPPAMGALINTFRKIKAGSSPKTPNFTGNLIGLTNEATIDVWAARMLRRLSGKSRIPPAAEKGLTGSHNKGSTLMQPNVGGEFGFGQTVFRNAADKINASGIIKTIDPALGDLGPDDLQAISWFIEKEIWTKNGWTTKSGEGGSLDYEMSLAGAADPQRIYELRRAINTGFKAPPKRKVETDSAYDLRVMDARTAYDKQRTAMQDELAAINAPAQMVQLGISGERPNSPMSNYNQAEMAAELDDVVRDDKSVLAYNLENTYGSYQGKTERSLNAEFAVGENFDPAPLTRRLIEQGKQYDQDSVFISRSVSNTHANARPGVEIYFKEAITPEKMAKLTKRLREYGVDGFTYVTDARFGNKVARQARTGGPETGALTGLRFQYVPEFDEVFDPTRRAEIYKEKQKLFEDILSDTINDSNVSDARLGYYDTNVYFRSDYDVYLGRNDTAGNSQTGGGLPSGENVPQATGSREVGAELPAGVYDGVGSAAPTKKAKGGNVERVYNDRKYI
jgi:hypothetical protein